MPDIEFELGGEGPQIRLAGAVYFGWEDWGWAVSLMLSAPGVGVAVPVGCSHDQLESLARAAFAERGGAAATARASRLQAVLSGPEPRCSGALVVAGAFDDPVFAAEYHQVVPDGRAPQWAK